MLRSFQNGSLSSSGAALRGLALAAVLGPLTACVVQNTPGGTPDATPIGEPPPVATVPPGTPPPPGPATPPPPPTTQQPPAGGGDPAMAGTWSSPSCGDRKYERIITLNADGTFTAQDMVSPCPPGAACVWSGIVNRKGRYTRSGDTITLTVEGPSGPQGKPFPATMAVDAGARAPAEQAGSAACVYVKK